MDWVITAGALWLWYSWSTQPRGAEQSPDLRVALAMAVAALERSNKAIEGLRTGLRSIESQNATVHRKLQRSREHYEGINSRPDIDSAEVVAASIQDRIGRILSDVDLDSRTPGGGRWTRIRRK